MLFGKRDVSGISGVSPNVNLNFTSSEIQSGEFQFSHTFLEGALVLHWKLEKDMGVIRFGMLVQGSGYGGVGTGASMHGSDMVLGREVDGALNVGDYYFGADDDGEPVLDTEMGGSDSILAFTALRRPNEATGATESVFKWIRPLDKMDAKWDTAIVTNMAQDMIVAYHPTAMDLTEHRRKEITRINWITGQVGGAAPLRIAHGTLMGFGWLFLTLGALFARYTRWYLNFTGIKSPIWFTVHFYNQVWWFSMVSIAFVIAFVMAKVMHVDHFGSMAHSVLGVILYILALFQVVWAFFRPDVRKDGSGKPLAKQPPVRAAWSWIHILLGPVLLILAVPTVLTGFNAIHAPTGVWVAYLVFMGALFVAVSTLELLRFFKALCWSKANRSEEMVKVDSD